MSETLSKFGRSPFINPEAKRGDPEFKYPDPDLGDEILEDVEKYWSHSHAESEWQMVFRKTWNLAGRVQDVANTGDYFTFDLGPESFLITKNESGEIRAFYNVCQHRGARLVRTEFGNSPQFVCGFHSWTWKLDGTLKKITDEESFQPNVICDRPALVEVRCAEWGGFIFINMDDDAPELETYLSRLPSHLAAYRMEDMCVVRDVSIEWDANWKTALDAFMESYHVHIRHPETLAYLDEYHAQLDIFDEGHSRLIVPMSCKSPRVNDQCSLTDEQAVMLSEIGLDPEKYRAQADTVRSTIQAEKRSWAAGIGLDYGAYTDSQLTDDWTYNIFPNVTFNIHLEGALVMRFRPHPKDPEKCFYDIWVLAHVIPDPEYKLPSYLGVDDVDITKPVPRPPRIKMRHGDASLGEVLDQDAEMIPFVQTGMKSAGFRGLRLGRQEDRLRNFYQVYNRYMEADND